MHSILSPSPPRCAVEDFLPLLSYPVDCHPILGAEYLGPGAAGGGAWYMAIAYGYINNGDVKILVRSITHYSLFLMICSILLLSENWGLSPSSDAVNHTPDQLVQKLEAMKPEVMTQWSRSLCRRSQEEDKEPGNFGDPLLGSLIRCSFFMLKVADIPTYHDHHDPSSIIQHHQYQAESGHVQHRDAQ